MMPPFNYAVLWQVSGTLLSHPQTVHVQLQKEYTNIQCHIPVAYPGILFGEGSTNSAEDRENGDLGAVPP
jgi:hypothetical protein